MGYIKELPEDLIKKIAAGEVIERPASVIKELVENSIDAKATKIEIETERACKVIKVSDNGLGIDPSDIDLLFKRHATSKIKRFDDLWTIDTLGFRGEALSSISAVSKITCRSKHINEECGFEIRVIDGKISKKSSGISIGTVFEIDDLFYNVPARQKFLKSQSTEYSYIHEIVLSLALSHPKISFNLINNKTKDLSSSGSGDLNLAICELLGQDLNKNLISIQAKNEFVEVSGYVGALEVYRANRKSVYIFVNNRPVKCQIISKAIFGAYEGLLPAGKFPVVILYLSFKPKFVDVNVHPTKKEVRYTHPNDVYQLVLRSIQNAISDYYKKEYREKSSYSLPETSDKRIPPSPSLPFAPSPVRPLASSPVCPTSPPPSPPLFSINNLRCETIYSDRVIANMTKIGNKTIFEVGNIFDDNIQIVFSGEITGDAKYQSDFFNFLSDLGSKMYKSFINEEQVIQKKLLEKKLEDEEIKESTRKKPPKSLLYTIWDRDNWTCVYCAKQLLDPELIKKALPAAKDAFVTYRNSQGDEVTTHILQEHIASYDHYLPVSKLPQFNFDTENLFACCIECNRKKSNSMSLNSWQPLRTNNWNKSLEIAGLCFSTPRTLDSVSLAPTAFTVI